MSTTARTQFGPDPPITQVPPDFAACLHQQSCGGSCDEIVGSEASGQGYCAEPEWAGTTYCACANAPTPQAACFFAPCTNSALAYVPCNQRQIVSAGLCPRSIICNQIANVGGSDNVTQNIVQQCGVISNVTNQIQANPIFAVIVFVLIVTLVILLAMRPSDSNPLPFGAVIF